MTDSSLPTEAEILDQLLDQLVSEDVKARREAAKRLGEIGNPEAIAELANAYRRDSDAGVRRAAEESLRKFRRIEQEELGIPVESGGSSTNWGPILSRGRLVLAVTFAITFFVNAVILIGRALPPPATPEPPPATLTARNALVASYRQRITATRAEASTLRQVMSDIQGLGIHGVKKELCDSLPKSTVNKVDLSQIDAATYPDLKVVNDSINVPAQHIMMVRNNYLTLCGKTDANDFDNALKLSGGPAQNIQTIDNAVNKELSDAERDLKKAVDNPAPTVPPTATPTPPPTETPLPTATPTHTPVPSTATEVSVPTQSPTPQVVVPQTVTLNDLKLTTLKSYKYKATVNTSGTLISNNKTFRGVLNLSVTQQNNPLVAQYDVIVNEGADKLALLKPYISQGLYVPGTSLYVLTADALYEMGDVLKAAKFNGRCRTTVSPSIQATSKLQSIQLGPFAGMQLTLKPGDEKMINGVKAAHYTAERKIGDNKEQIQTIDAYIGLQDGVVMSLNGTITLDSAASAAVKKSFGMQQYTMTFNYELTAVNVAVDLQKPATCTS